jgi:hypothetical protein
MHRNLRIRWTVITFVVLIWADIILPIWRRNGIVMYLKTMCWKIKDYEWFNHLHSTLPSQPVFPHLWVLFRERMLASFTPYVNLVSCTMSVSFPPFVNPVPCTYVAESSAWQNTTLKRERHPCPQRDRTRDPSKWAAVDHRLRPLGLWDRLAIFAG